MDRLTCTKAVVVHKAAHGLGARSLSAIATVLEDFVSVTRLNVDFVAGNVRPILEGGLPVEADVTVDNRS